MHSRSSHRFIVFLTVCSLLLDSILPIFAFQQTAAAASSPQESPQTNQKAPKAVPTDFPKSVGTVFDAPRSAISTPPPSSTAQAAGAAKKNQPSSVLFIENVGQFDARAKFQAKAQGGAIYFAEDAIWFSVAEQATINSLEERREKLRDLKSFQPETKKGVNLKLGFVGANRKPQIEPFGRMDARISYLIGNDANKWHKNVPVWSGIRYKDLYPGIDLELTSLDGRFTPRFVVRDRAKVDAIRLRLDGVGKLEMSSQIVKANTELGSVTLPTFQIIDKKGKPLNDLSSFARIENAEFNPSLSDASGAQESALNSLYLLYATYLGGSHEDAGEGIATDAQGAMYVTGHTCSPDFVPISGLYTFGNCNDAFITKLTPTGALEYSTFVGGTVIIGVAGEGNDEAMSIAVDTNGVVYVVGWTTSTNFPTANAYQTTYPKQLSYPLPAVVTGFALKLNATGTALVYSTYLGGSGDVEWDAPSEVALGNDGSIYITGATESTDFPIEQAYQDIIAGETDAFVTRLNTTGNALVFSTYLGGTKKDYGYGIALDSNGAIYVTGYTTSSNFPLSAPFQNTCYCDETQSDAFVTKFSPDGSALEYSTFLGGTSAEGGNAIATDDTGAAYVIGTTSSTNFPTEQATYPSLAGDSDVFVTKFAPSGSQLLYSTYLGGSRDDYGKGIQVDSNGIVYLAGDTSSGNFPKTDDAYARSLGGGQDAFVTKLDATAALVYSTYYGGSDGESVHSLAIDIDGNAYVTGETDSTDLPLKDPFDATNENIWLSYHPEAFVAKLGTGYSSSSLLPNQFIYNAKGDCPCMNAGQQAILSTPHSINTRTGGEDHQVTDLSIPSLAGQMSFVRSYSSLATEIYTTTLGYGWTHNWETRLILPTQEGGVSGQVLFKLHTSNQFIFYENSYANGAITYRPAPGVVADLYSLGEIGGYSVALPDQSYFTFDNEGKLLERSDSKGRYLRTDSYLTQGTNVVNCAP